MAQRMVAEAAAGNEHDAAWRILDNCSQNCEHRAAPQTRVLAFREATGRVPVVDFLDGLPAKAREKCFNRIRRLGALGHELRRPEADLLRDRIYELRASYQRVHYRILYFYDGGDAVILSHGLTKERAVPPAEIDRAVQRRALYLQDRPRYGFEGDFL